MTNPDDDSLRASDTDRQAVAEQLRAAQDEGRLSLAEYDERLRQAYAAVTFADLKPLTSDIPSTAPEKQDASAVTRRERGRMAPKWRSWAAVSLMLIGIWAVTSFPFDGPMSIWPIYPIGIWGVVLVVSTLFGSRSDGSRDDSDRDDSDR